MMVLAKASDLFCSASCDMSVLLLYIRYEHVYWYGLLQWWDSIMNLITEALVKDS